MQGLSGIRPSKNKSVKTRILTAFIRSCIRPGCTLSVCQNLRLAHTTRPLGVNITDRRTRVSPSFFPHNRTFLPQKSAFLPATRVPNAPLLGVGFRAVFEGRVRALSDERSQKLPRCGLRNKGTTFHGFGSRIWFKDENGSWGWVA